VDHPRGRVGHSRHVVEGPQRRLLAQLHGALRDVHGHVSHPLEIGDDLQGRRDEPEVRGGGLSQGQQVQTEVIDRQLAGVHLRVRRDDPARQIGVAIPERSHRRSDHFFDGAPEKENLLPERLQIVLVVAAAVLQRSLRSLPPSSAVARGTWRAARDLSSSSVLFRHGGFRHKNVTRE
jgi:hypothetical protein